MHKGFTLLLALSLSSLIRCQTDSTDQHILSESQAWGYGILAGIGVSLLGFLAAIVLIIAKKCCADSNFTIVIKFFFSLAFGALTGDAVVHIIAEAYANSEVDKRIVSMIFILSIVAFLLLDRFMHAIGISHHHWVEEGNEGHAHEHHKHTDNAHKANHQHNEKHQHGHHVHDHNCEGQLNPKVQNPEESSPNKPIQMREDILGSNKVFQEQIEREKQTGNNEDETQECCGCCKSLKGKESAGYMNIVGSFIHNFIDGLALGIVFATRNTLNIIPLIIAIVAHEIPRELGDVAILLRSNFTGVQTILCNGVVNFTSLIGVIIGLAIVNMSEVAKIYVMIFVAGNFIYIAADIWQNLFKNRGEGAKCHNFIEFVGAGVGIGAMFALTYLEVEGAEH